MSNTCIIEYGESTDCLYLAFSIFFKLKSVNIAEKRVEVIRKLVYVDSSYSTNALIGINCSCCNPSTQNDEVNAHCDKAPTTSLNGAQLDLGGDKKASWWSLDTVQLIHHLHAAAAVPYVSRDVIWQEDGRERRLRRRRHNYSSSSSSTVMINDCLCCSEVVKTLNSTRSPAPPRTSLLRRWMRRYWFDRRATTTVQFRRQSVWFALLIL